MPPKRKPAGEPAASAPQPRKRRGTQPLEGNAAHIDGMVVARDFWDTIATDYLFTWATDYNTPAARALPKERAALLEFLVETVGVEVPEGETREDQVKKLKACWRKRGGRGAFPAVDAAPEDEQQSHAASDDEGAGAPDPGRVAPSQPASPPSSTPPLNQEAQDADDTQVALNHSARAEALMQSALARIAAMEARGTVPASAADAPSPPRTCLTCGTTAPVGAGAGRFNCSRCHLRGDVPLQHADNQFIIQAGLSGFSAPAAPAATTSASSSTTVGQSATSTRPSLSVLDQSLVRMLERGAAMPLFTGPAAGEAVPHSQALLLAARAYDAPKYQPPSEHLIALIRAGKLCDIGYALPRPHQSLAGADAEDAPGLLSLSGGTVQFVNKVPVAPVVANSQQFCMALFATILPALADRPRAMLEWITLGQTALALESAQSWTVASTYLQRALAAYTQAGKPFADEVDPQVLLPIVLGAPQGQRSGGASGPAHQRGAGGAGGADRPCFNWNAGLACSRAPCTFAHTCQGCGAAHRVSDCTSAGAGQAKRAPASSSSISSRTHSRGRRPHGSAAPAGSSSATTA